MDGRYTLLGTLLLWLFYVTATGQTMQGQIVDATTGDPMDKVNIHNVHTETGTASNDDGMFQITVSNGHLVEFRKPGYKIIRVRIPEGSLPPFFKVGMEQSSTELPMVEVRGIAKDYKSDSERYVAIYKHALSFPEMSTAQMMRSPFSALSKRNRQIWAFQKEFEWFQQQKFIYYIYYDFFFLMKRLLKKLPV